MIAATGPLSIKLCNYVTNVKREAPDLSGIRPLGVGVGEADGDHVDAVPLPVGLLSASQIVYYRTNRTER